MSAPRRSIALVSLAPLEHDARVLRHARALRDVGYAVTIVAEGPLPAEPGVPVAVVGALKAAWRVRLGMGAQQGLSTVLPITATASYWLSVTRARAWRALAELRPDLVIANDWRSLPLAAAAKRAWGAKVIYDSHEFATEEFADSWRWRLLAQRHVLEIEGRLVRSADLVMTVGEGLASALSEMYALHPAPLVIPNLPDVEPIEPHRTGRPIEVLYHGIIAPRRGLEALVLAAKLLGGTHRIILRGPVRSDFDGRLRSAAGASVAIEPPVPPDRLVESAARSDIGIFVFESGTGQASHALPNKVFEYVAAGLLPVSSDLPAVRLLFEREAIGVLLPANDAASIATVLGQLGPKTIDCRRRAAASRARRFTFSEVRGVFTDATAALLQSRGAS